MVKQRKLLIAGIIFVVVVLIFLGPLKKASTFFYGLFFDKNISLKTEKNGSINVLLLGIGGGTHEGPDLTDTIMVANINPQRNTVNLISVPRDLWIPDLNQKINAAYTTGNEKGKGLLLAKATAQKVTGIQIDYVIVIDFSGFIKLVDYVGGIDVNVLNTLDDYSYPIDGKEAETCGHSEDEIKQFTASVSAESQLWDFFSCRYKHLHVDSGTIHMDGTTALEFVRSRHAAGDEGTDFARSQRQQIVINAIKQKVLSLGIVLNPIKVFGVYSIIKNNINTDIQTDEFDDFVKLSNEMKKAAIKSFVIDTGDENKNRYGLLENPPLSNKYQYAWVLVPRVGDGNFSEIKNYTDCIIQGKTCEVEKSGISVK